MTTSGKRTDAIGSGKDRRPAGQTHQAVLGGLMCVVALVVVGVILVRPSPNAAGDHATDVSPISLPRATTNTRARATTAVKKPARVKPRAKVPTTTTPTTAPAAIVRPVTTTTRPFVRTTVTSPRPVTAVTPATTPATSPTTTPTVAVPYTPPTQKPPDTIAVPINPSSIPTIPLVPTSLPIG